MRVMLACIAFVYVCSVTLCAPLSFDSVSCLCINCLG